MQPRDAVICTSRAAKAVMVRVLDNYADYLGRRGGGRFQVELKMPVIPLGVDCDSFLKDEQAARVRSGLRRGLGIGAEDFVALYFGRLSFHAKAHPLAMYLTLEEAHRRSGRRMHLVQVGRFPNAGIEREFRDGAARFCPSVHAIFLDGHDEAVSRDVWYAADAFVSLSDNVQESFGLTPVEAMAAGLPCVVSDWNGYRDTVRDGADGFAVPTWLPLAGSGVEELPWPRP
ncbi:MAG: glycosyltransferase family 4 protein [Rhodospirillaceae bacterium]